LENQDKIALKWREYDSIEKIEHLEGVQKAIVTSKSPNSLQILDPDDYSPIDLEMTEKLEKINIGEEIDVIKIDGKIYII
jgi:nonsense-mediated mRNA decay protein 3